MHLVSRLLDYSFDMPLLNLRAASVIHNAPEKKRVKETGQRNANKETNKETGSE
jgi:hypothetical protein